MVLALTRGTLFGYLFSYSICQLLADFFVCRNEVVESGND
nr:MAG TPA: hypothetical protein [Caudoviricetes sp.]